ncbi:MAG: hypothetical protein HRT58_08515 [Crocinitomicaceae bacterium]|nr:hypothetical protein [Flavobacteriales bacterium]NQZ35693.1 hypothetical protein [Crocinitomicaceae bacterium]
MRPQSSENSPQLIENFYHLRSDFDRMEVQEILAYLTLSHRRYQNTVIPQIEQSFFGLLKLFPNQPSLSVIFNIFLKFQISLELHMKLEEETVFKNVHHKKEVSSQEMNSDHEHSHEEPFLDELISCLKRQKCASNPFCRILLSQLRNFDRELQEHAWIEEHLI